MSSDRRCKRRTRESIELVAVEVEVGVVGGVVVKSSLLYIEVVVG